MSRAPSILFWMMAFVLGAGIGAYAYLKVKPRYIMHRTMDQMTARLGDRTNTFFHFSRLATHADRTVVRPNHDTIYSSAVIDPAAAPNGLRLDVPDTGGRYFSFQFTDDTTDVFHVLSHTDALKPCYLLQVDITSTPSAADRDCGQVQVPSERSWLLFRVRLTGTEPATWVQNVQTHIDLQLR